MYFVIFCLHFIQFNMEKKRSSVDLVFSVLGAVKQEKMRKGNCYYAHFDTTTLLCFLVLIDISDDRNCNNNKKTVIIYSPLRSFKSV